MAITHDQVKRSRLTLNKFESGVKQLKPSREVSLGLTNLQRSFMFLGLVLKDMGTPNPYPESHNKESMSIEPKADVSPSQYNFEATEQTTMVKELRNDMENEIQNIINMYKAAFDTECDPERKPLFFTHILMAITSLEESKMWLGMELGRILDEANFKRQSSATS